VLSRKDVLTLLDQLVPPFRLIGEILYGSGLRLAEAIAIRVKDVDIERRQIMIRRGKGQNDRPALLPTTMVYTHFVDRGPLGVISPRDR
jgi:integrase